MSSKTSNEIKESIAELENGFNEMRDLARDRYDQLHVETKYENSLVANLHESVTTRIPYASRLPSYDAWATQGILRQDLSFHVEPAGTKDNDETRADKLELFYAHQFGVIFNEGGRLLEATRRHQVVSPFAAWWLEYDAFALPTEANKREAYRKSYAPFKLSIIDPLSAAFLPDDNGQPTAGSRHFELPYIDVAKRYGKGDSKNALRILREQFPMLRGGQGRQLEENDLYTKRAKVWVLDDGDTICHAIEIKAGRGGPQYTQMGDDYPNPFGSPSLIIVPGRYNPEGQTKGQQYEPLLVDEFNAQRKVDVAMSHVASLAMTPNKHGQVVPEDVARAAVMDDKTIPSPDFSQGVANLYGDLAELKTGLDIGSAREVLAHAKEERDATRPPPYLTNPDEATMRNATASGQLNAYETSNKPYDAPREAVIGGITRVCMMMKHFICEGHLNKKGVGEAAKEKIHFSLSGAEPASKYIGDRKGEELEISPDDFEDGDTLEITTAASSQSQKALEFELAHTQRTLGYKTADQVVETFTEDVSGQIAKLNEEAEYQFYVPMVLRMTFLTFIEQLRLKDGIDLSFMTMQSGLFPEPPGAVPPQTQNAGSPDVGGYRVDPPATGVPNAGVTAG